MRDSGDLTLLIHRGMVAAGWDIDKIYGRLGYDVRELPLNESRPRHALQPEYWRVIQTVTDDPDAGLHLCPYLPHYRGGGLEYIVLCSPTLGDGLKAVIPYRRLISDAFNAELVQDHRGTRIAFVGTVNDTPQHRHSEMCFVKTFLNIVHSATENAFEPTHVSLRCPRISEQADYESVFGCPVSFDGQQNEIWFAPKMLDMPLPHHDAGLLHLHRQHANRRLAAVARLDKMDAVYVYLLNQFEKGTLDDEQTHTLARAAYDLGLSSRRLRFELGEVGTSFRDLYRRARLAYAKQLLEQTVDRVEDVALRAGFSEASSFSRAFRHYVGLTPSEYRAHNDN